MTTIDQAKIQEIALEGFGLINGLVASLGADCGMKAGLFEALRDHGPATSAALAKATGFHERCNAATDLRPGVRGRIEQRLLRRRVLEAQRAQLLRCRLREVAHRAGRAEAKFKLR